MGTSFFESMSTPFAKNFENLSAPVETTALRACFEAMYIVRKTQTPVMSNALNYF